MAASKDEVNRKLTFRMYEDGVHRWRSQGENIFNEDTSNKCPTYVHRTPPCQGSCPSGEDVRGWLNIVRGIELPPLRSACRNTRSAAPPTPTRFHR
jgi:glutamate synthase (NADPH/NADH) small chain